MQKAIAHLLAFALFQPVHAAVTPDFLSVQDSWILGEGQFISEPSGTGIVVDQTNPPMLSVVNVTLAPLQAWFSVNLNDPITPEYITTYTPFYESSSAPSSDIENVFIGQSFYWAFWFDNWEDDAGFEIVDPGDQIGWARLQWTASGIQIIESYSEDSGSGMIVGSQTPIPELKLLPTLLGILSFAFTFLARAKRLKAHNFS